MPASSIAISKPKARQIDFPGEGEIVDTAGEVIGQHAGIHRYTIGQRRGIGIAEQQAAVRDLTSTLPGIESWSVTIRNLLGSRIHRSRRELGRV